LPITALIVPGPQRPDQIVLVQVDALREGRVVISDAATFTFLPHTRARIDFILRPICLGTSCSTNERACSRDCHCVALPLKPFTGTLQTDGGFQTESPPPDGACSSADL